MTSKFFLSKEHCNLEECIMLQINNFIPSLVIEDTVSSAVMRFFIYSCVSSFLSSWDKFWTLKTSKNDVNLMWFIAKINE